MEPTATSKTVLVSAACRENMVSKEANISTGDFSLCSSLYRTRVPAFSAEEVLEVLSQDWPGGSARATGASPRKLTP